MASICLLALIGLPGAGKTSFCSWLRQQQLQINSNIIHLCYDNFLNEHVTFCNYKRTRKDIVELLINITKTLKASSQLPKQMLLSKNIAYTELKGSTNYLIICDDNHYYRSMRYKLYQISRLQQICFAQIFFECDLTTALQRNEARDVAAILPLNIITKMSKRLEKPNHVVYSWENNTFALSNLSELNKQNAVDFVRNSFHKEIAAVSDLNAKSPSPNSKLHQLDLLLRNRIGEILRATTEEKKLEIINLNKKRKAILAQYKQEYNDEIHNMKSFNFYVNLLNET